MDWKPIEIELEGAKYPCHIAAHKGVWYIARTKSPLFCLRAETPDDAVLRAMGALIFWDKSRTVPEAEPQQ